MAGQKAFVRFDLHQRIQHITLLITFVLLAFTGLPIKFANSSISHWIVSLFGGVDNLLSVHMIMAALLTVVFVYHLLYLILYPFVTKKKSLAIVPSGKDFVDVTQDVLYMLGLRKERPQFDRYSYKEKFDYWAVFWGVAIMGGSGLLMWLPQTFTQYMPRWVIDASRYAHTDEAILAVSAIFIWHFFNVHLTPKFFPMSRVWYKGTLTREELAEEHPLELKRLEAEDKRH